MNSDKIYTMNVSTQPYKGARDFYPEDKQLQKWMFDKWRRVVERYGYVEYDAPILEPTSLYLMKGSQEIVNEQTYTFEDRGGRSVTIRTEMTPTVSRMVAGRRQELAYPVRWYSIPNLWRYERTQRGRLREFWQLNVDVFGVESVDAEIELIKIMDDLLQAFKAKRSSYVIKLNSRLLVDSALALYGLHTERAKDAIRLIDRMSKMKASEFVEALNAITHDEAATRGIIEFLTIKNVDDLQQELKVLKSYDELHDVIGQCKSMGIRNIEFDSSLMRGFDYYTDLVFEVFDTDPENNRSMFGGGRYDGLVGQFGAEPVPTVGFGMGDVTFYNFLVTHKLLPKPSTTVEATILIRDEESVYAANNVAKELREIGVNVSVDYTRRKIDKQLKTAVKSGVRYVVFVGQEELAMELFTIKDLKNSKEQKHSIARIASIVKDQRNK